MNTDERNLLLNFLNELRQVGSVTKDPDADGMIRNALANHPHALYLLVQKALIQDQALRHAAQQVEALQARITQLESGGGHAPAGGFLSGSGWGSRAAPAPGPVMSPGNDGGYPPVPPPAQSPAPASGGGSFLRTAAGVAAGVAAGSFLASGISSFFSGGSSSASSPDNTSFLGDSDSHAFDATAADAQSEGTGGFFSGLSNLFGSGDEGATSGEDSGSDDFSSDV